MLKPFDQPGVTFIGLPSHIQQHDDGTQLAGILQISFDHRRPGIGHSAGNAGEAVSRKIDEVELVVNDEKIDKLGLARRRARLDQVFPVKHALMSEDLPTFERPAKAICGLLSWGTASGPGR